MGAAKDLVSFCLAGRLAGPPPLPVPVPSESKYIHGSMDHARCAAPGGALTRKPGGQKQQHWDTAADSQICCCIARLLGTFWNSTTGKRLLPRCTKRDPGCSACRCGQPGTWGFGVVRPCSRPPPLHPLQCSRWQPPSCRRRRCYHPRAPPTARLRPLHAEVGRKKKNSSSTPHCGDRHLHTQKHHDTEIIPATRRNASSASRTPATVRARDRQSIEQPSDIPCRASAASPNPTRGQSSPELPHFPWLCDHGGGLGAPHPPPNILCSLHFNRRRFAIIVTCPGAQWRAFSCPRCSPT